MKQIALMLALLLLLAGCGGREEGSGGADLQEQSQAGDGVQAPEGPPQTPPGEAEGEESQPEEESEPALPVLDKPSITPEQAAELLTPGDDGIYRIATIKQLSALAVLVNEGNTFEGQTVVLESDLNLSGINFVPIGNSRDPGPQHYYPPVNAFFGTFDGGGHVISGLTILDASHGSGLFGCIGTGAVIKDVHITGGQIYSGTFGGGIVGYCHGGTVTRCSFRGAITGGATSTGGIVGWLYAGTVSECAANAQIEGHSSVGGLVGSSMSGTVISDCYALGTVTAVPHAALNDEPSFIGGLVGDTGGEILRCHASIEVYTKASARFVGGFAGSANPDNFTACYFNYKPVANWKPIGDQPEDAELEGLTACTVEEITEQSTFAGWDFTSVWAIDEGRNRGLPFLWAISE